MCIICENRNDDFGMSKLHELTYIDCSECKNIKVIPSLKNLRKLKCIYCKSLTTIEVSKNLIKLLRMLLFKRNSCIKTTYKIKL
jgi:hypothetical protein